MAVDLSALSKATTTANALSNLILVSPQENVGIQAQPKKTEDGEDVQQPKKFLFNYEGEQKVDLQSDITDHFVEDNSAIQDQIALRPEIITTTGFIGELNNVVPESLKPIRLAADKLTPVAAFAPELSISAEITYNNAFQAYQIAKNTEAASVEAWSSVQGTESEPNQTKQQIAFQEFYGYWKNRQLFTVQTPWAIFKDMAIQTLRAMQPDDSNSYSEFQVVFKAMRFASTFRFSQSQIYDPSQFQGRTFNQGAPLIDKGIQNPVETDSFRTFIG